MTLPQPLDQRPRKIQIGCGYDKREGYLNVDIDPACEPDLLIVNGDYSGIPRDFFEELLAKDVLEHIPRPETLSALLDFSDYLVMGGKMIVQTSSILHVATRLQQSTRFSDHHGWTICLFGNQAHPGDFHYTGFTEVTLRVHMLAAGFEIDRLQMRDDWMFYLESKKVSDWTSLLDRRNLANEEFLQKAYQQAFFRSIDEEGSVHFTNALLAGADRKLVLKRIFSSPERLSRIAERNGL